MTTSWIEIDDATKEVVSTKRRGFTRWQVSALLRTVAVIQAKQGKSFIPQWEARATLIRIFGPGNADHTMTDPEMVYETQLVPGDPAYPKNGGGKVYWIVGYKIGCTMRVRDYWGNLIYECTEWHFEENAPLPNRGEAHAFAMTSGESYALRRALISLGDAFGLHLYNKGGMLPVVKGTYLLDDPQSPLYEKPVQADDQPKAVLPHQRPGTAPIIIDAPDDGSAEWPDTDPEAPGSDSEQEKPKTSRSRKPPVQAPMPPTAPAGPADLQAGFNQE